MTAIKAVEDYYIRTTRQDVRDSLVMAGEQCVLLSMARPEIDKDTPRCPACNDDVYSSTDGECSVCYGTSMYPPIKDVRRVHGLFADHIVSEQFLKQGMWAADSREAQFEWYPLLVEHDFIIRVRQWDANGRATELEGFYGVQAVTRDSLRTGTRFGQERWDVIGQRAVISKLAPTLPICSYPVLGVDFSTPVNITGPVVVVPPDQRVVLVPAGATEPESYTFEQPTPADPWIIVHPLDHYPSVALIVNGEVVEAPVSYPAPDTVVVTFGQPVAGRAELV